MNGDKWPWLKTQGWLATFVLLVIGPLGWYVLYRRGNNASGRPLR